MRFLLDQGNGVSNDGLWGRVVLTRSTPGLISRPLGARVVNSSKDYYVVRDDIHEWLTQRSTNYGLSWDLWDEAHIREGYTHAWVLDLECSPNIAMLFKLTWL